MGGVAQPVTAHEESLDAETTSTGIEYQRSGWRGALAGAFATFVALAVVIVLKQITGIVSILDALAEVILSWIPLGLFSKLIDIFGTAAKAWLFVGMGATLVLIGAGAGWLFSPPTIPPTRPIWRTGLSFALAALATLSLFMLWAVDLRVGGILTYTELVKVLLCVWRRHSRLVWPSRSLFPTSPAVARRFDQISQRLTARDADCSK